MPSKVRTLTSLRVATFHANSYGFRTGRSAHDAQRQIANNLTSEKNGNTKRILELDIEKCVRRDSSRGIPNQVGRD